MKETTSTPRNLEEFVPEIKEPSFSPVYGTAEPEVVIERMETEDFLAEALPPIIAQSDNKLIFWERYRVASDEEKQKVNDYLGVGPDPSKGDLWKAFIKL